MVENHNGAVSMVGIFVISKFDMYVEKMDYNLR